MNAPQKQQLRKELQSCNVGLKRNWKKIAEVLQLSGRQTQSKPMAAPTRPTDVAAKPHRCLGGTRICFSHNLKIHRGSQRLHEWRGNEQIFPCVEASQCIRLRQSERMVRVPHLDPEPPFAKRGRKKLILRSHEAVGNPGDSSSSMKGRMRRFTCKHTEGINIPKNGIPKLRTHSHTGGRQSMQGAG